MHQIAPFKNIYLIIIFFEGEHITEPLSPNNRHAIIIPPLSKSICATPLPKINPTIVGYEPAGLTVHSLPE